MTKHEILASHNCYYSEHFKNAQKSNSCPKFSGTRIVTAQDLARAQLGAGDSVMNRLYEYVKSDGGKIDEQIDKFTGAQASAEHLTWSYANILHALHIRKGLMKSFNILAQI